MKTNEKIKQFTHSLLFLALITILLTLISCAKNEPQTAKPDKNISIENETLLNELDEHNELITLSNEDIEAFGLKFNKVEPGFIVSEIEIPGEISIDPDRLVHISSYISGIVISSNKGIGDYVKKGELLAVIDSKELAEAKANYLITLEKFELASVNFKREEELYNERITSQKEFLEAKNDLFQAKIDLKLARQKLDILNVNVNNFSQKNKDNFNNLSKYYIYSPFSGTIIEKHFSKGEYIENVRETFLIADLSIVWAELKVNQEDLHLIHPGMKVTIKDTAGTNQTKAVIQYVQPIVNEESRTTIARVILNNSQRIWKPGMFIYGNIIKENTRVPLMLNKNGIQEIDNEEHVFIKVGENKFKAQEVKTGQSNKQYIEILSGLKEGQTYVSEGAFLLKSQLSKESFGGDHDH